MACIACRGHFTANLHRISWLEKLGVAKSLQFHIGFCGWSSLDYQFYLPQLRILGTTPLERPVFWLEMLRVKCLNMQAANALGGKLYEREGDELQVWVHVRV